MGVCEMAVCSKCDSEISGRTVTFKENPFHPECFCCKQCNEQLVGKKIRQHDGENYDEDCYAAHFAKKCGKCSEVCMEPGVKYTVYNGETYHPECFACDQCNQAIVGKKFANKDGKRICEDCL